MNIAVLMVLLLSQGTYLDSCQCQWVDEDNCCMETVAGSCCQGVSTAHDFMGFKGACPKHMDRAHQDEVVPQGEASTVITVPWSVLTPWLDVQFPRLQEGVIPGFATPAAPRPPDLHRLSRLIC